MQLSFFENLGLEVRVYEGIIAQNTREEIHRVTQSLLPTEKPSSLVAAIFLAHPSITAAFPAEGARAVGWVQTPLLCLQEQSVPPNGLRVMLICAPPGTNWVGVRGANTVQTTPKNAFLSLLAVIEEQNPWVPASTRGIITTVTSDIETFSPQNTLNNLRWSQCLCLNGFELNVSSIPKVLRVLLFVEAKETAKHVFLQETISLRPDLQKG